MNLYNVPETHVVYWDTIADTTAEVEQVPAEFSDGIGGFEYLVVPAGILEFEHATGGYDTFRDDGSVESLIIVSEALPEEVRPFWVAHLVMHKVMHDDGTPHLCERHDRSIKKFLAEAEPTLIGPYYNETTQAYAMGKRWHERNGGYVIELERYARALRHSKRKGEDAHSADTARQRLADIGLVLPDQELALSAVDRTTGDRTTISLQIEGGSRHKCKSCSHHITRGSERITTSTQANRHGYDHHHFHPGCFTHVSLGIFGDFHQTEPYLPH